MSTAIARNFQIGIDPTPTNNFTLYQPATPDGTLRLGNGNTGITSSLLTLTSAGNLGIGQTPTAYGATVRNVEAYIAGASGYTLVSASTASVRTEIASSEGSLLGQVGTRTNHPLVLKANNAEAMRVTTDGLVGIGTTSPNLNTNGTVLHINNGTASRAAVVHMTNAESGSGAANGLICGKWSDGTNYFFDYSSNPIILGTSGTNRVTVTSSGSVGIGTTSPTANLEVIGAISSVNGYQDNIVLQNALSGSRNRFLLGQSLASGAYIYTDAPGGVAAALPMTFWTAGTERARIDTSGNVGIGTSSPSDVLTLNRAGSTNVFQRITNGANTSGFYVGLDTLGQANVYQAGNAPLLFATNATERARIDSSGNLLVGTTTATGKVTIGASNLWTTGATFAGAGGNAAWTTGFASQALNSALQTPFAITAGGVYSVSDIRVKENFKPITSGLAFVNAVEPVQFEWKDDKTADTGYKAQELLAKGYGHLVSAIPDATMEECVHEDGNISPAGVRFIAKYDSVVPILHKAIQELKAEFDAYKATHP